MLKHAVNVSPEMTAFLGAGAIDRAACPPDAELFRFDLDGTATVAVAPSSVEEAVLVFAVQRAACRRIFGFVPDAPGVWHLPVGLRAIALAIRDCALPEPARSTLRLAKCIELLCAMFAELAAETLVAVDGAGALNALDAGRIADARRLIDEQWREKLTLDRIARACGLNRAKLTRGFRQMYDVSVAEAITERRLGGAHAMLLATDLPVSSVGYACGYRNNASFTRAFSRRFGVAPTRLRIGIAA